MTTATAINTTVITNNNNKEKTMQNVAETTKTNRIRSNSKGHNNKDIAKNSARIIDNSKVDKIGVSELSTSRPTKFPAASRKKYSEKISAFLADARKACEGERKVQASINNFILREKYTTQAELSEFLKELQGHALWPAGKKPVSPASFFGKKSAWAVSEDRKYYIKEKTGEKVQYSIVRFCFAVWKALANARAKERSNTSIKITIGLEEAIALNNAITELQKYALTSKDTMLQELNSALVAARTASGLSEKVEKQLES